MKEKYIIFELYDDICALNVDEILEIVEIDSMIKTSSKELNLIVWNKLTVPVIDPVPMITLVGEHIPTVHSRVLIVEKNALKFGILVDKVNGIQVLNKSLMEEPSLTEARYVTGKIDEFKIFSPDVFLSDKMMAKFRQAYQIELVNLEEAIMIHGEKAEGKEEIVETVRLRSLNWLIHATRQKIDESFINDAIEIHDLVAKLQ